MLFHELKKHVDIPVFKGIPNALDYISYSNLYYKAIEKNTYEIYGKSATMLDATKVMNGFGNVAYFHWFPDIFKQTKAELGRFYQPTFSLAAQSEFSDYLHGLTHLRSRSEHTFLGEILAVPDNLYSNGVGYSTFIEMNRNIHLNQCTQLLFDLFELDKQRISYKLLYKTNIIYNTFFFQKEENTHYKIYLEEYFKVDIPTKRTGMDYLTNPANPFEIRLGNNTIRAIYMDIKFKEFGSQKKAFIHTSVADSSKESCANIFSTKEEDFWINKIHEILRSDSSKSQLQQIVNSTITKDSSAQKLAVDTIKELYECVTN